ncbi:copper amine oxidase N-terminal domain-containing protein [Paenibacillus sp. SYP-B3998]|uniref:Copper amine oxidase N-terminal domain-containing protein n=1 Tax=Paenibacillus sp. SYP-B3998 TaxID=2678564 RepID=A0A6G3ZY24_9BACL|nr:stalk domain-containing protein [Paenibacillus sp. SYP-B3998]NEW07113.1 copper amine oxidase N-terminal domain-containing protein [Paenibacillus sp. SYP-B3998]
MIKKLVKSILVGMILLLSSQSTYANEVSKLNNHEISLKLNDKTAVVNGQAVTLPAAPILLNNTTMVPLRMIGDSLEAETKWDDSTRTITILLAKQAIYLTVDQTIATVNGTSVKLDQPATIINETAMVPLRFISENLNQTVTFDSSTQMITIKNKKIEVQPLGPKKLDNPTVDNLTLSIGKPDRYIYQYDGPSIRSKQESISSFVADRNNNIFMIDFKNDRPALSQYYISSYNQENGSSKKLQHVVNIDEKFNIEYKDKTGIVQNLKYFDLAPKQLFYDEQHDKVYLLANVDKKDITTVIYEVLPNVQMLTYHLDCVMDEESDFFATLNEKQFYYSNTLQERVYSFEIGKERDTTGVLSSSLKQQLVSTVKESAIYVLDTVNRTISKLDTKGSLQEVAKVNLKQINGAASRDGFFYVADEQGFYKLSTDGAIENYVKLNELAYKHGLYDPAKKMYEKMVPGVAGYMEYSEGNMSQGGEKEPSSLSLGNSIDFTVDSKGNIVIYDTTNRMIRRINLYHTKND